jgi:hypothetical protein
MLVGVDPTPTHDVPAFEATPSMTVSSTVVTSGRYYRAGMAIIVAANRHSGQM